jgi:DNA-binding NtrC family response regulator
VASRNPSDPHEAATLLRQRFDPSPLPDAAFVFTVVEGVDLDRTFKLEGLLASRILVGQSPACEIRLSDPQVSRRHAALDLAGTRLRIADLDSTNGTFVDGVAIVEAFLSGGEIVRLGSTALLLTREAARDAVALPFAARFGRVIGRSTEMRRLYPLCERLAASTVPVIIEGETGTGKEQLAEALHEAGPRAAGPFIVFDCTAVPPNLIESELFGHERGAFTGAVSARKGVFEQAHGGTLLIDEIGDLEASLQPKLLRAIERSEVRRIGGDRSIRFDVRILSATRRNLDHEVQAGRFRDDLFHRLAVARIELPPLRHRRGDVPVLAAHFWNEAGGGDRPIPDAILRRWEDYAWPGNVRELRNAVARTLALGDLEGAPSPHAEGGEGAIPEGPPSGPPSRAPGSPDIIDAVLARRLPLAAARQQVIEHFERRYIERVLAEHGGSVVRAAEASGIARRYFQILRRERSKGPPGSEG